MYTRLVFRPARKSWRLVLGMPVISNDYQWVRDFEYESGAELVRLEDIGELSARIVRKGGQRAGHVDVLMGLSVRPVGHRRLHDQVLLRISIATQDCVRVRREGSVRRGPCRGECSHFKVLGRFRIGCVFGVVTLVTVFSVIGLFGGDLRYLERAPYLAERRSPAESQLVGNSVVLVLCQCLVILPLLFVLLKLIIPGMEWGALALLPMSGLTLLGGVLVSQNRQVLNSMLLNVARPLSLIGALLGAMALGLSFEFSSVTAFSLSYTVVLFIAVLMLASASISFRGVTYLVKGDWFQVFAGLRVHGGVPYLVRTSGPIDHDLCARRSRRRCVFGRAKCA